MKLLLTSGGIENDTIRAAFFGLVGGSVTGKKCVFVPTASTINDGDKCWLVDAMASIRSLGEWASFDIVDLACEGIDHVARLSAADVIVAWGGSEYFLNYWLRKHIGDGLKDLINDKVWVGASAGSMVLGNPVNYVASQQIYVEYTPAEYRDENVYSLVDFAILPHYGSDEYIGTSVEQIEASANLVSGKVYALDDQSAIVVNGENIEVVGGDEWRVFGDGRI
jgi:dipeptidase E